MFFLNVQTHALEKQQTFACVGNVIVLVGHFGVHTLLTNLKHGDDLSRLPLLVVQRVKAERLEQGSHYAFVPLIHHRQVCQNIDQQLRGLFSLFEHTRHKE